MNPLFVKKENNLKTFLNGEHYLDFQGDHFVK